MKNLSTFWSRSIFPRCICLAELLAMLCYCGAATGQLPDSADSHIFWRESFHEGHLPPGWKNVDVHQLGCEWTVTNQPYPGSYGYQQQAPPIASVSRGFHLQYQAGYIVDEDQPSWQKKKIYPDAYIQTAPIDCSRRQSVNLRFQQTFRYNDYSRSDTAGLFAGVSTDGVNWHDINIMHQAPASADMFVPMQEDINISRWAANQPTVYIRFYWKGFFSWYWMIDDIELTTSYQRDIGLVRLASQQEAGNDFGHRDSLVVRIKNSGSEAIKEDFDVSVTLDRQQHPLLVRVPASRFPFAADSEMDVRFPDVDLALLPSHRLHVGLNLRGDENPSNNALDLTIHAKATSLGRITGFLSNDSETVVESGVSKLKIIFYREDICRIWLAPDGEFSDPAGTEIVENLPKTRAVTALTDKGAYYALQSKRSVLRIYKYPIHLAMFDRDNQRLIWEEATPLVFGAQTTQTLIRQPGEYVYGCGMQNGYFSHLNKDLLIEKGGGWDDGGRSNPVPFFMSTAGYGVFRNTFDAGKYSFRDTMGLSHNENRFDAFYFLGTSLKEILGLYTSLTGRPFLMPRWALGLGDANCYNKPGRDKQAQTTPVVISRVADRYIQHDMPRGWILPNDGYGCGYDHLDSVIRELSKRGFHTGLWTENGVDRIGREVGEYGSRLCKLDVAWVGPGYKFALDACRSAYLGIENNCPERGFVWSVMGWAGTQRYSTVWSGDQQGNWEYIRFHIPSVIGAGLSGFNAATGDVDGIFGGSDSTFTRDLEWKCFTPVFMVMSGWAKKDKQPFVAAEPFRSINRNYLQLKMRLTPYLYTYCNMAHQTGVPTVRAMVLEFPGDSVTRGTATQYQFMAGEWLLVAPVFKSEAKRDSIYLPAGKWTDFWTGARFGGGAWINNYPAPLDRLPVFVRAGAIIPSYPLMHYDGERKADTLTLDIYPSGKSAFELYEDDGLTRQYQQGAFSKTRIEVQGGNKLTVTIHPYRGNYQGMLASRWYLIRIHGLMAPKRVSFNGKKIQQFMPGLAKHKPGEEVSYFDPREQGGVLTFRSMLVSTSVKQLLELDYK